MHRAQLDISSLSVCDAPLLVVVGMKREARLLAADNVVIIAGGGDAGSLFARFDQALAAGSPRAVLSMGLAGALSPMLNVGDWVVADEVVDGERAWSTDKALRRRLIAASVLDSARIGRIAGSDAMVVSAAAKGALYSTTSALAVDMESHLAGRFAKTHGLPFAAVRVISDGADRALPKAAQAGMKPDGGMDVLAVLRALAKAPHQVPALIRTAREAEVAFRRLKLLGRDDLLSRLGIGELDLGQLPLDVA